MDSKAFVNRLRTIKQVNKHNPRLLNKDLYRLVISEPALIAGYELIKSHKRFATPATELEGRDGRALRDNYCAERNHGFGPVRLGKLVSSLLSESWKPKPARRLNTPKAFTFASHEKRIQTLEEEIVQSSLKIVLEAVYEPIFTPFSYGFRPNLGAHDALKNISMKYENASFAIEGSIKGVYDNVNHHNLVSLLSHKVKDERLLSLIWKLLKAGYMGFSHPYSSEIGTPQNPILSPLP